MCALADPHFELLEHRAARWLDAENLRSVRWLPADVQVIGAIEGSRVLVTR